MTTTLTPRDYRLPGRVLKDDLATLLRDSPEAFDCLVWIAKDSTHDEQVTVEEDVVGSIESGERAQSYEEPVPARARIVPDDGLAFGVLSSGLAENFLGTSQPLRLLLSVPGVRKYSLIQWLEYPTLDAESPEPRTVYVLDSAPIGRTLGVGIAYTCLPLPALGEIPDNAREGEPQPDGGQDVVGVL